VLVAVDPVGFWEAPDQQMDFDTMVETGIQKDNGETVHTFPTEHIVPSGKVPPRAASTPADPGLTKDERWGVAKTGMKNAVVGMAESAINQQIPGPFKLSLPRFEYPSASPGSYSQWQIDQQATAGEWFVHTTVAGGTIAGGIVAGSVLEGIALRQSSVVAERAFQQEVQSQVIASV
jgi:hypothetical protein